MYKEKIPVWFREAVLSAEVPQELKRKVLNNKQTTPLFLKHLTREVMNAASQVALKNKKAPSLKNVKELTYDLSKGWIMNIEETAKRMYESDLKRIQREQEATKAKELDLASQGIMTGEFEEYKKDGLVVAEKEIGSRT